MWILLGCHYRKIMLIVNEQKAGSDDLSVCWYPNCSRPSVITKTYNSCADIR